jgi:hypothetical protein
MIKGDDVVCTASKVRYMMLSVASLASILKVMSTPPAFFQKHSIKTVQIMTIEVFFGEKIDYFIVINIVTR